MTKDATGNLRGHGSRQCATRVGERRIRRRRLNAVALAPVGGLGWAGAGGMQRDAKGKLGNGSFSCGGHVT